MLTAASLPDATGRAGVLPHQPGGCWPRMVSCGSLQVLAIKQTSRSALDLLSFLMFLSLFIFEREIESQQGRGREREGDRVPSRLYASGAEPDVGLELRNHEIMT